MITPPYITHIHLSPICNFARYYIGQFFSVFFLGSLTALVLAICIWSISPAGMSTLPSKRTLPTVTWLRNILHACASVLLSAQVAKAKHKITRATSASGICRQEAPIDDITARSDHPPNQDSMAQIALIPIEIGVPLAAPVEVADTDSPAVPAHVPMANLAVIHPPPPPILPPVVQSYLVEMADLNEKAYDQRPKEPGKTLCGDYKFVGDARAGQVEVWRKGDEHRVVVVIRGTTFGRELRLDRALFDESVHRVGQKPSLFTEECLVILDTVVRLLRRFTLANFLIDITGHSLGAALAEALLHLLRQREGYKNVRASTFDSPGLPQRFRHDHGVTFPLPSLITLQSTPNPVNTLNAPLAGPAPLQRDSYSGFYSCGRGSNTPINWALAASLIYPSNHWETIDFFWNASTKIRRLAESHTLAHIKGFLIGNHIRPEDPDMWPRFMLDTSLPGRICLRIMGGPLALPIERLVQQCPPQAQPTPMAGGAIPGEGQVAVESRGLVLAVREREKVREKGRAAAGRKARVREVIDAMIDNDEDIWGVEDEDDDPADYIEVDSD